MEDYLRYGLLLIAAVILALILTESWVRRRRLRLAELSSVSPPIEPTHSNFSRQQAGMDTDQCIMSLPKTEEPLNLASKSDAPQPESDILTVSVFAKPNTRFVSYDLLQSISATGMEFGEWNIFHYYSHANDKRVTLFSMASATKPGDFHLDKMGDFSCVGLTLFMDMSSVPHAEDAFSKMLETAELLAEDLDGELYAGPRKPWSSQILQDYQQRILQRQH